MEEEILRQIIAEVMKVDPREIDEDTTLIEDLGADSLDIMRIIINIEERFSLKLPGNAVNELLTPADAIKMIKKVKKA
ncbi:acyl carrier protein [Lachnospiraceae bacterium YSD2013]|jgi:acyl carrier protein|nr:acyl carrier protein [Lachnospiraceae bacterium]MBR5994493.1 acyl carrier protein [Lachnospiraceae bacterium]SCX00926.1 acyl carrier protein [Lachnospiraceae bacterium YSD2013]